MHDNHITDIMDTTNLATLCGGASGGEAQQGAPCSRMQMISVRSRIFSTSKLKRFGTVPRHGRGNSTTKDLPTWHHAGASRTSWANASSRLVSWCASKRLNPFDHRWSKALYPVPVAYLVCSVSATAGTSTSTMKSAFG